MGSTLLKIQPSLLHVPTDKDVTVVIHLPWLWFDPDDFDDDDGFDEWEAEDELRYLFEDDDDDEDLTP